MVARIRVKRVQHVKLTADIKGPRTVRVGFPAGKTSGAVVNRAIWNHYGTSRGIPARPFLAIAMRKNRSKYIQALRTSAAKLIRGQTTLDTVMNKLGILAQGDIQMSITELRTPPNAPSTIAAKGSSNPLIDTGEMRQAVTWEVR